MRVFFTARDRSMNRPFAMNQVRLGRNFARSGVHGERDFLTVRVPFRRTVRNAPTAVPNRTQPPACWRAHLADAVQAICLDGRQRAPGSGRCPAMLGRAVRAAHQATCGVLTLRASIANACSPPPRACALRLPKTVRLGGGRLAVPFTVARRSRCQGLRARCALAAWRPSAEP